VAPNIKTVAAKMIGVEKFFKNFRITELLSGPDVCLQAQSTLLRSVHERFNVQDADKL
jgi:hypothetical protein